MSLASINIFACSSCNIRWYNFRHHTQLWGRGGVLISRETFSHPVLRAETSIVAVSLAQWVGFLISLCGEES